MLFPSGMVYSLNQERWLAIFKFCPMLFNPHLNVQLSSFFFLSSLNFCHKCLCCQLSVAYVAHIFVHVGYQHGVGQLSLVASSINRI